jgi:hypothetical protein
VSAPAGVGHVPFFTPPQVTVPGDAANTVLEVTVKGKDDIRFRSGILRPDDDPGFRTGVRFDN